MKSMLDLEGYEAYCEVYQNHLKEYGLSKLNERNFSSIKRIQGQEVISERDLILDGKLPRLRNLDSENDLLEWEPNFGSIFEGVPANVALFMYSRALESEINRLKEK